MSCLCIWTVPAFAGSPWNSHPIAVRRPHSSPMIKLPPVPRASINVELESALLTESTHARIVPKPCLTRQSGLRLKPSLSLLSLPFLRLPGADSSACGLLPVALARGLTPA